MAQTLPLWGEMTSVLTFAEAQGTFASRAMQQASYPEAVPLAVELAEQTLQWCPERRATARQLLEKPLGRQEEAPEGQLGPPEYIIYKLICNIMISVVVF